MSRRSAVALSLLLGAATLVVAKDKKKNVLPTYFLNARTVLVLIEPGAGAPITDPASNRTALDDVEKAISKWGWLTPVIDEQTADLIFTIRKGHGKVAEPTIAGGGVNDRPVIVQSTDNSVRIGGQRGRQSSSSTLPEDPSLHPQTEIGSRDDTFSVYQGHIEHPLDRPAIWRYSAKDALRSPEVRAVTEFRKAIEETQRQQKPQP